MILLYIISITAQQDSLKEFWPLDVGNTWQFRDQNNKVSRYGMVVSEDTLLSNGFRYAKIGAPPHFNTGYSYDRIDSLYRIQSYTPWAPDSCGGTANLESSSYHLADSAGSIWSDCLNWNGFLGPPAIRYEGIRMIGVFGELRQAMVFQFGYYDFNINEYLFVTRDVLVRGIGLYRREYWHSGGYEQLTGAIINGVTYGNIVSVNANHLDEPFKFTLYQNYPNPFNPSTSISYSLNEAGKVQIKIYDVLGSEVVTLVDDVREKGVYAATFDGSNLSSGIYLARISIISNNRLAFSKTIKMIMAK